MKCTRILRRILSLKKRILSKIHSHSAELLSCGGTVAAICGATLALAHAGLLDKRPHTSNGAGFLEMFCPAYKKGRRLFCAYAIIAAIKGGAFHTNFIRHALTVCKE